MPKEVVYDLNEAHNQISFARENGATIVCGDTSVTYHKCDKDHPPWCKSEWFATKNGSKVELRGNEVMSWLENARCQPKP